MSYTLEQRSASKYAGAQKCVNIATTTIGKSGVFLFQKYVVLVDYMRFGPLAEKGNNWAIREAVSVNGRHFGVWNGPKLWSGRGQLGVSGLGFVFKHRAAAELEIERIVSGRSMEGAPTLYAVSAVTISGALESVVDQVYGGNWHGAERLQ